MSVPGREDHVEVEPREAEPLAALERLLRVIRLERAVAREHVAVDVLEDRDLELRAVHGRAGVARELRDRPDVVEVRVGEQDRLDGLLELRDQAVALVPGVDHDRPLGPVDDPAVLLERPDREAADVHVFCCCLRRWLRW
jgi:hypothetical protein